MRCGWCDGRTGNASLAVLQGAPFDQTAGNVIIGVAVGALTSGVVGAFLGPDANPIWGLVAGSASAAATTAISDVVAGRSLGSDVLLSAAISAAQGAVTLGLKAVIGPSQASADAQCGRGSGAARVERAESARAMVRDPGPDLRLAANPFEDCEAGGCRYTLYIPLPEGLPGELAAVAAWLREALGLGEAAATAAPAAEGPLVYGPSAGGQLAATAARLGGQTLSALEKPIELGWAEFSTQTLADAAAAGRQVIFDHTNMQNIPGCARRHLIRRRHFQHRTSVHSTELGCYAAGRPVHQQRGERDAAVVEFRELKAVVLTANRGTLKFSGPDPSWVHATLLQDGMERELGAESFKYVSDRMCAFLKGPSRETKWVLTLSETHVTAYGSTVADGVLLRFQDKNAKFFAELLVSKEEQELWLSVLRAGLQ